MCLLLPLTLLNYQIVLEADGYQPYLISPEKGLRSLIKGVLELAKEPSRLCVDEVFMFIRYLHLSYFLLWLLDSYSNDFLVIILSVGWSFRLYSVTTWIVLSCENVGFCGGTLNCSTSSKYICKNFLVRMTLI